MRDGAVAARLSHKQKAGGSSPSPATKLFQVGHKACQVTVNHWLGGSIPPPGAN